MKLYLPVQPATEKISSKRNSPNFPVTFQCPAMWLTVNMLSEIYSRGSHDRKRGYKMKRRNSFI